ncbi:MAG: P-II family nitrogen regulator [Pirellulaceae bacterium]|nr:P-II family nitrogen regulator [Pirellulaceae bacterium]
MRMIIAIIQPTKLSAVRDALRDQGIDHLTVGDAMGYGRQGGKLASFRGNEYKVDLLRKVTLEIVVNEDALEPALEVIRKTALTGTEGEIGDGKIFVIPIADVIDIGSANRGPHAI